jgi:hypothetical protein
MNIKLNELSLLFLAELSVGASTPFPPHLSVVTLNYTWSVRGSGGKGKREDYWSTMHESTRRNEDEKNPMSLYGGKMRASE